MRDEARHVCYAREGSSGTEETGWWGRVLDRDGIVRGTGWIHTLYRALRAEWWKGNSLPLQSL